MGTHICNLSTSEAVTGDSPTRASLSHETMPWCLLFSDDWGSVLPFTLGPPHILALGPRLAYSI